MPIYCSLTTDDIKSAYEIIYVQFIGIWTGNYTA